MKNVRDPNGVDGLLEAVLADDDWQALNSSLKREALVAIGAARRRRRLRHWIGRTACAVVLLAGAGWWLLPLASVRPPVSATSGYAASSGTRVPFISEDEMLAMFPAGSCVVAEVNGRKELVFFDAQRAAEGFVMDRRYRQ